MTTPTPSSTQRVYYPIGRTFEILLGIAILVLAGYVLFDLINLVRTGQTSDIWLKVFLLITLMVVLINRVLALSKKLIISPDALCCYHLGFRVSTPWSNLDQLCFLPGGLRPGAVLRLHQPAPIDRSWFWIGRQGSLIAIPLLGYDYDPGSPLRKDLEHYAPQLFRSPSAN